MDCSQDEITCQVIEMMLAILSTGSSLVATGRALIMEKRYYLFAIVLGAVLPYCYFIPFVIEHGLNFSVFFRQLFANRVSAFFAMDVLVSSFALWGFIYIEGKRLGMPRLWVYVLANLSVGVSLALPLFLYDRAANVSRRSCR